MKREPETLCLQAVGVLYRHDRVLFVETVRRVALTGKVKSFRDGAVGKPSLNRARVSESRPETGDLSMSRLKLP